MIATKFQALYQTWERKKMRKTQFLHSRRS